MPPRTPPPPPTPPPSPSQNPAAPDFVAPVWGREESPSEGCRAAVQGARALFRLHGRLVRARNRGLFVYGITSAQLRILETMRDHPGENLSVIAWRLDLTRQAVHRVVHDLVRHLFVSLERDPQDRRAVIPKVTIFGSVYAEGALDWHETAGAELIAGLRLLDIQFASAMLDRLWRRTPSGNEPTRNVRSWNEDELG